MPPTDPRPEARYLTIGPLAMLRWAQTPSEVRVDAGDTGREHHSREPNDAVAAARALAPGIIEARSETKEQRRLPKSIITALVESQLCRLAVPSELDGLELRPCSGATGVRGACQSLGVCRLDRLE